METSGIWRPNGAHPGGMPECQKTGNACDGQGAVWHPYGVLLRYDATPEVCAALRPPATVCQPSGLNRESFGRLYVFLDRL
jgi:hypothetical protein